MLSAHLSSLRIGHYQPELVGIVSGCARDSERRLTPDSLTVEACWSVEKALFRALLSQLHPGREWNPTSKELGRMTFGGDPSINMVTDHDGKGDYLTGNAICQVSGMSEYESTMNYLFDRYEREIVPKLAPRTQKDYKRILYRLRVEFGERPYLSMKPRDVGRFLQETPAKVSANRHVSVLSAVFSKAIGKWYVHDDLRNPCVGVERNETKPRDRYVTDAEFKALYAIVSPSVKIAMELARMVGQRQGDLLRATWKQIDTNKRLFYFQQGKTGKKLAVRVTPALEELLVRARRLPPLVPRLYLIRRRDGHPYTSEGFKALWQRWMKRAMKRGVLKERFTFHDLRAKCVSDNKSIEAAMQLAGHSNMSMTRRVYDRGIREVDPLE